jgi:hypothetical protein
MATVVGASHTWLLSCKPSGIPNLPADPATVLVAPEAEDIEFTVPAGQSATVFSGQIPAAKVISLVMHSTQSNVNVNTGAQTFALGTAKAIGWSTQMAGVANPLTGDVTNMVVDNTAGLKDTVFRASFLVQP